jgi:hypothetical protein
MKFIKQGPDNEVQKVQVEFGIQAPSSLNQRKEKKDLL